jgi:DNA processing protein
MEVFTLRRGDPGYPAPLERLPEPPAWLRVRGNLLAARRVALVGARLPDEYGDSMAAALAWGLARAGLSVVSGGAQGVDAAAHRGALEAGGHTVAVMGCGLDHAYPAGHRDLFERIVAAGGALVSEYDDAFHPERWTFPERNRIVAALCDAVVVVRAGERSGALITAGWARRLGVPLLAVPGEAGHPLSAGPLALLRAGARPAVEPEDVLRELGLARSAAPAPARPEPGGDAGAVLRALGGRGCHADEVAREAGLGAGAALAALLSLELAGLVEQRPGQVFRRREGRSP